jgi:hypothetical protein
MHWNDGIHTSPKTGVDRTRPETHQNHIHRLKEQIRTQTARTAFQG